MPKALHVAKVGTRRGSDPDTLRFIPAAGERHPRGEIQNPKHEIRNKPKAQTKQNDKNEAPSHGPGSGLRFGFGVSVIQACFGFRASGFGFTSSPAAPAS